MHRARSAQVRSTNSVQNFSLCLFLLFFFVEIYPANRISGLKTSSFILVGEVLNMLANSPDRQGAKEYILLRGAKNEENEGVLLPSLFLLPCLASSTRF